jgi:transposase
MPKPYSRDLRKRVVDFVEAGHSRRAAARHFDVSPSFVVNLMTSYRLRGSLIPKPIGGRHAKLDPHRAFLLSRLAEKNDITTGIGGRARSPLRHAGRSRLALALAHPQRLSL